MSDIPRINRGGMPNMPARGGSSLAFWAVGAIVLIAVILWLNPFYIVQSGTVGVKQSLGQTVGIIRPGWEIVLPWQSVEVYSTREEIIRDESVMAFSKDAQESKNVVSVNYKLDESTAASVHQTLGPAYAEKIVRPALQKRLKEIYSRYNATEIVGKRETLGVEVENQIKSAMPPGITVVSVQIENIDFSDSYTSAIEAAAQAQAEVKKAEQELLKQKIEAEKVVVNAEAAAKARVAQATAEAEAIRVKGDAEAGAIKAKSEALRESPNLVQLTATEKWNGVLPTTMVPGSSVPFVNVSAQR